MLSSCGNFIWLLILIAICTLKSPQLVSASTSLPESINIGAIFERGDEQQLLASSLARAVEHINQNRAILPRTRLNVTAYVVDSHDDSFNAAKLACKLMQDRVWAIFSPSRSESINWYIRSLANELQIPHLSISWSYRSKYLFNVNTELPQSKKEQEHYTVSLYPEAGQLSEAYRDFVLSRNWKSFTLIFDEDEGLVALKDLLRISSAVTRRHVKISVMQFPIDKKVGNSNDNHDSANDYDEDYIYRKLLKDLKKSEHNFVLSLAPERALGFMKQAYESKRMSEYDNFLITSLDMHRMSHLSDFRHKTLANITGLSLLRSTDKKIHHISTSEALISDAVTLFARALDDLDRSLSPDDIVEPAVSCEMVSGGGGQKWPFGPHIVQYIKTMKAIGITGAIEFDQHGHRVNFTLDVLQLKPDGLKNIARWDKAYGITSMANYTFYDSYKQILEAMKYKELRVTVPPISEPYIYLKPNHEELSGNDKFEGFGVDLLGMIAEVFQKDFQSDFKYSIRIVADQKYGRPNQETGEWDGMLGELMRHQADLAIADLTATYLRETAVDFTMPFMNLGIAILFKKTAQPEPVLFSFLKPLSVEVWLYLASAYLGISILFWILSRISPYEWVSPHSCDPQPLELENQFSIGNSLWFTIGSLMQQGSDVAPRALSTRILAGVWWFFTLIMISSYTANLAASLTLSRMAPAISNVEDLAKQTSIQYGCKKGGSTHEFFQNSNHTTYQRMYNTMEANQEVYINRLEDAIERVRKGGYAYLAESSTIEYLVQRKCDLYQVGSWLDSKGYGIATPTDSPYRTPISNAIVVLQDRGLLYELKKRWWVDKGGGLCTDDGVKGSSAMELNIENVGGVFVVLMGGVGIGCFFGAIEFIWKSLKIARDERDSIGKLIWLEIVRICTGGGSSRPVHQASSSNTLNQNPNTFNGDLPPPLPYLHQRPQPYYSSSSYDNINMAPLLSPSSAPSKSMMSRLNSNDHNPSPKSPSSYSTMY